MSENRAFGMLVAGNSVNALQICSIALVLLLITTRDGTTVQETLMTHFWPQGPLNYFLVITPVILAGICNCQPTQSFKPGG